MADVYVAVGQGHLTAREGAGVVFPGVKEQERQQVVPLAKARKAKGNGPTVPIKGLIPGMAVHFAQCCHPLPGDRIVGIEPPAAG